MLLRWIVHVSSQYVHGEGYVRSSYVVDKNTTSHDFLIVFDAMFVRCRISIYVLLSRTIAPLESNARVDWYSNYSRSVYIA